MKKLLIIFALLASPAFAQSQYQPHQIVGNPLGTKATSTGVGVVSPLVLDTSGLRCPTCASLVNGSALTSVSDTNVTVTLGGSPSNALLNPTSLTMGWVGTLAAGRLNPNVVQSVSNDTNISGFISAQNLTLGWLGTLDATRLNANVVQSFTNDTNIHAAISAQNATLSWSGLLAVSRGGTGVATSTGTGATVLNTSPNITTPTGIVKGDVGLGNVANVDTTNAANISSGILPTARLPNIPVANLNSGTGASASTAWFGDGTWKTPAGGGNVSNSGAPTAGQFALWTSSTVVQGVSPASKSDQQTATSVTAAVTPSQQQSHPSSVKAWGSIATTTPRSPTILASYNVASVSSASVGSVVVTFTTPFATANYSCHITTGIGPTSSSGTVGYIPNKTTSTVSLGTINFSGSGADPTTSIDFDCEGGQ